jgi:DNA-binding transcriptional regulator YdaS (Cro superfamily)
MTTKETRVAAIDTAIERGGGIVRFAKAVGVTHQAVYNWKARGWVPPKRAVAIEAVFSVDRDSLMNPDLVRAINAPVADIS